MTSGVRAQQTRTALQLPLLVTALVDAAMIVVFAATGRRSHDEGLSVLGIVDTAWPFLAGAAVGWSLTYVYTHIGTTDQPGSRAFRPERVVPYGIAIWFFTVAVGMALRAVLHQGTAAWFIAVATLALCVFLLGWRTVAARLYHLVRR